MKDIFTTFPTVGSHDHQTENEDLRARVEQLEQQNRENQQRSNQQQEPPRKSRWKRFVKFFDKVVTPILNFVTDFMNALANLKHGKSRRYA